VLPEKNPNYAFARLSRISGKQKKTERKRRELLFRVLNNAPACRHLLVVSGSEADAMYLASVNSSAVCVFVSQNAKEDFFLQKGFQNIHVVQNFKMAIRYFSTIDFVLFGTVEEKEITECLQHIHQETIFAFLNTYEQNAKKWAFISNQQQVQLIIRTFRLGLVYFNPDIQKGNYTLLY
jgi:hypothetical protein